MPHKDYTLENLNRREKALAKKIMKEVLSDILEDGGGGCQVFHNREESERILGTSGRLTIIFDGGAVYDFLSINGDAEWMGCSLRLKLNQLCDREKVWFEDQNSWSIVIHDL